MNPFESMQALGRSLGQGRPGHGIRLPAGHEGDGRRDERGLRCLVCARQQGIGRGTTCVRAVLVRGAGPLVLLDQGNAGQRWVGLLRSDRRGHAGADPRSARLDVGDERGRRGAPAHGGRATPCRSVERGASVRRGVQRLGQAAPAQLRAQQGHARCLDAGGRRLRQAAERKGRERRAAARLDAGVPDALGRDGQRGPAGDAAHRRLPGNPARGAEGLDRPQACPADRRRVLQRDVRLSHARRARRRPQVRHRIAARAPRVEALHAPHDASVAGA